MTFAAAMTWISRLASMATAVAALELIVIHRAWSERGVYRWSALRREYSPLGARLAGLAFATPGMWLVLAVQLASGLALPWLAQPVWPWLALASTLAIAARFRGTYNGGSDAMLLVVLLGLAVARSGAPEVGLGYIAAQLLLSYVLAGVAKVRERAWRDGTALAALVALPAYGISPVDHKSRAVVANNSKFVVRFDGLYEGERNIDAVVQCARSLAREPRP